jgi:hypothetical protein
MSTTENSESRPAKGGKGNAGDGTLNKFEAARLAKKKQRRKAHRKTILRSNTNG